MRQTVDRGAVKSVLPWILDVKLDTVLKIQIEMRAVTRDSLNSLNTFFRRQMKE